MIIVPSFDEIQARIKRTLELMDNVVIGGDVLPKGSMPDVPDPDEEEDGEDEEKSLQAILDRARSSIFG